MHTETLTHYSPSLGRDMHMAVFGHGGTPFLVFPTQDGMCRQWEDFGLTGQLCDYIDTGRIQLFSVDTVDSESWSARGADNAWRAARQEQYYRYIVDQAVPLIRERNAGPLMVTGCSMGADHTAIVFLRRPDLFAGMLALSGVYDADYFFDGYMDGVLYENSPERFLPGMQADHPYVRSYNEKKIVFCVGQGAWEEDGVRTLRFLKTQFDRLGVHAWCDFWGYDVDHDWPWWSKQLRYFLPFLLDGR